MRYTRFVLLAAVTLSSVNNGVEAQEISSEKPPETPKDVYSNIRHEDYIGPEACGECHEKNYSDWSQHPHSRMNQLATDETVVGDFSGTSFTYGVGRAVFLKRDGAFLMEYYQGEKRIRTFRITRTIGWRYEQDYLGVQIEGPEPPGHPLYTSESYLQFGYLFGQEQWLPQFYYNPEPGPEYGNDGTSNLDPFMPMPEHYFTERCVFCHNTYSYDTRLYADRTGTQSPPFAPIKALAEADGSHESNPEFFEQLQKLSYTQQVHELPTSKLVTDGISCESCHFGGREHSDGETEIRFQPSHPLLADWTPYQKTLRTAQDEGRRVESQVIDSKQNPAVVNAICRQCHVSGLHAKWPDGSALYNSLESLEQDSGGCMSELKCTHCHNPHVGGPDAGAPDRKEHLDACLACHEDLQSQKAAAAHSNHDPGQVSCLDCHMPRVVQGVDVYSRSHRISSPTDPKILLTGMPNACNLCHLDESLAWTRDALASGWASKPIQLPRALEPLFGKEFGRPVGDTWLAHPNGGIRVVAAAAYARSSHGKESLPELIGLLNDPNAYYRTRSLQVVERIMGRRFSKDEYYVVAPPQQRQMQVERLLKRFSK
jgi:hypothetical protein